MEPREDGGGKGNGGGGLEETKQKSGKAEEEDEREARERREARPERDEEDSREYKREERWMMEIDFAVVFLQLSRGLTFWEVACAFSVFKIHRVPGSGKSRFFNVSKHRFKR